MFAALFNIAATCCIITVLITNSVSILNEDLVVNYFKYKNLRLGYVLNCLPFKEKVEFAKVLMGSGLGISESSINRQGLVLIITKNTNSHHVGIILDGNCDNLDNLLKSAEISFLFDDTHHWLIVASNYSFLTEYSNLPLNINCDVYVAIPHLEDQEKIYNWIINDVYNPAYNHGGKLKSEHIGFYNRSCGFQVKQRGYKYWARRNMTEVTLKTMAVLRQPSDTTLEEYLDNNNDRKKDAFTMFQYRLTQHCQELYNFSLKINMTDSWGYEHEDGTFDGLTEALQNKEIDFASAALYVKEERIPIMDFAMGLWLFREIFVYLNPQERSFSQVFLQSMGTTAWLATLAISLLIIITLKLTQKYELNVMKSVKDSLDQAWSSLIIFTLGMFCQQGSSEIPFLCGGRIITTSSLVFCLLFYQFYSGTIVSILLTKPPKMIRTPEDLVRSSLTVGSDDAPYVADFYRTTTDPVAIEMYRRKMLDAGGSPKYYTNAEGLKLVEEGGFAYQVEKTAGYIIIQETFSGKAICELGKIQIFPTKRLMTAVQKNSPFRDIFNYCMLRLDEHGIGSYQKQHWGASKPDCLKSSATVSLEVDLKQIYPIIVLLFMGMVISLVVLGFEILMKSNFQAKLNHKKHRNIPYYSFHN